jgi:hypothetical protein
MWGYDSPVRFDMVQVTEAKRPSSFEVIEATIRGPGTSDCTSDSIALEKE